MVRLSAQGEIGIVTAAWVGMLALLAQVVPDWSSGVRFGAGMGGALAALWVTRAAIDRWA